jgi:type III secretory pathway component EscS
MKNTPIELYMFALLFMLIEALGAFSRASVPAFLRLAVFAALVWFSLRGSRRAASVWCAICLLGMLVSFRQIWSTYQSSQSIPILLLLFCFIYTLIALYLWFSPRCRKFFNSDFLRTSTLPSEQPITQNGTPPR